MVSTAIDMPEGVALSDGEDSNQPNNANDPHRALDINLDEPIEQYVAKRPPPVLKVVQKVVDIIEEQKGMDKHKKSKKLKEHEKERKKMKKDRKESSSGLVDLVEVDRVEKTKVSDVVVEKKEKKVKKEKKKRKSKDIVELLVDAREVNESGSKSKQNSSQLLGYEEATGISTPSKEFE